MKRLLHQGSRSHGGAAIRAGVKAEPRKRGRCASLDPVPNRETGKGAGAVSGARPDKIRCDACPVLCYIAPGQTGACDRYANVGGRILRSDPVTVLSRTLEGGGAVVPFAPAEVLQDSCSKLHVDQLRHLIVEVVEAAGRVHDVVHASRSDDTVQLG
jgi:hypothetical protein